MNDFSKIKINNVEYHVKDETARNNLNNLQSQVKSLASGSPLVASSIDQMTDTTKTYVNTTDGNWYYHNGSEWTIGGTYQSTGIADESISFEKLSLEVQEILAKTTDIKVKDITYPKTTSYLNDGTTGVYNCWWTSDFIEIKSIYKAIKFKDVACLNSSLMINGISFFDESKNYISGICATSENINVVNIKDTVTTKNYDSMSGIVEIPTNAKYCIFEQFDNYAGFSSSNEIYFLIDNKDSLEGRVGKLEESITSLGIKNILCIGDSLTEGDYGSDPAGTKNVKSENYPYFLSEYLKCNVVNEGYCGLTPYQYWNQKAKGIDFINNTYDVIIIMLGTNHALTDTIENDTTIEEGETYENYTMTETGAYCAMIEYIMEQTNNKSQIILCCPPHAGVKRPDNRNHAINTNPVIKKVGEKYSLPVIDLLNEGGFSDYNQDIFQPIDHLHFGKEGYQKMATFIGSKIKSLFSYFE